MLLQLNCVIVDADAQYRQEMAEFLSGFGVSVVGQYGEVEQLPPVLGRQGAVQLVIVNLDPQPAAMLRRLGHMPRQYPGIAFCVMSQVVDAHLVMDAMHVGVTEYIPVPINEEKFVQSLDRIAQANGMGQRARVIHVIPTIGGCGSTTVACNVAAALAKDGARTALVDLDLIRGGVASYFDIRPRYTIADIMESSDKLDRQLLDNALALHKGSGLAVMARPELPEDTQRVKPPGFSRLLGVLSRMFDYIVLDSVMSVDPLYAMAVQAAELNVLVMQLNVPSAKNAERFVGALRRMGIDSPKMRLVANRFIKKGWDIEPSEVERLLGLKIQHYIPNDFKTAITAINLGEPFVLHAPKAEISQSLLNFAQQLRRPETAAAPGLAAASAAA